MNDLLARAIAHGRAEKLARLEAGIVDAVPEQVEMPLQLAKLGPSCTDYSFLTELEHTVVESGSRRTINRYGPIPWIHDVEDLEAEFFELISGVAPRFDPNLESEGALEIALNSISNFIGSPTIQWPNREDWPENTRIRAFRMIKFANNFLSTIWPQAFKEGRVLVFLSTNRSTRLQPLEERPSHKPTQIQNLFELVSQKIALLPDKNHAVGHGDQDISDALTMAEMQAIRERTEFLGLSEEPYWHEELQLRSEPKYYFLIFGKLPNELTDILQDRFKGIGPRSGHALKLEKELMDFFSAKFVEFPSSPGKEKCLSMIVAEAADRTGNSDGWNNLAKTRLERSSAIEMATTWKAPEKS